MSLDALEASSIEIKAGGGLYIVGTNLPNGEFRTKNIAELFQCSNSSAGNYLRELTKRGVVRIVNQQSREKVYIKAASLNDDPGWQHRLAEQKTVTAKRTTRHAENRKVRNDHAREVSKDRSEWQALHPKYLKRLNQEANFIHKLGFALTLNESYYPWSLRCTCFQERGKPCRSVGKHPVFIKGLQERGTETPFTNLKLFATVTRKRPYANLGMVLGKNHLGLDFDEIGAREELELEIGCPLNADTLTAESGSGFQHLIFSLPSTLNIIADTKVLTTRNGVAVEKWGLDLRSGNSQLIVEPSRHVSGGVYSWTNRTPPSLIQPELVEWLVATGKASWNEVSNVVKFPEAKKPVVLLPSVAETAPRMETMKFEAS